MVNIAGKGKFDVLRKDRIIKVLMQTGTRKSLARDASRPAKLPGKRVSKTGNIYWETRRNRSDERLKAI